MNLCFESYWRHWWLQKSHGIKVPRILGIERTHGTPSPSASFTREQGRSHVRHSVGLLHWSRVGVITSVLQSVKSTTKAHYHASEDVDLSWAMASCLDLISFGTLVSFTVSNRGLSSHSSLKPIRLDAVRQDATTFRFLCCWQHHVPNNRWFNTFARLHCSVCGCLIASMVGPRDGEGGEKTSEMYFSS